MKFLNKVSLFLFSLSFLTACNAANNIPIDENGENTFSLANYEFENIKSQVYNLLTREEGLTIEATFKDDRIYPETGDRRTTNLDISISGKSESLWLTYKSSVYQNEEQVDKNIYGIAYNSNVDAKDSIYSLNEDTWVVFDEGTYEGVENELDTLMDLFNIDSEVIAIASDIENQKINKTIVANRDAYRLTFEDKSQTYTQNITFDAGLLLPLSYSVVDGRSEDVFITKTGNITYFGVAKDEPLW